MATLLRPKRGFGFGHESGLLTYSLRPSLHEIRSVGLQLYARIACFWVLAVFGVLMHFYGV